MEQRERRSKSEQSGGAGSPDMGPGEVSIAWQGTGGGEGALWPRGSKDPHTPKAAPFIRSSSALLQGTQDRSRSALLCKEGSCLSHH